MLEFFPIKKLRALWRGWEGLRDLRWEVGAHRHHGLIDGKSTALGPKTAVHLVMVQDVFL